MRKAMIAAAMLASSGAADAVVVQWTTGTGANGHYYELVTGGQTFAGALAAAAAATPIAGYTAHLATITSANENAFIVSTVFPAAQAGLQATWVAGSDAVTEGVWQWVAGPETGQVFWNGGPGGSSPTYANWNPGSEPNNAGGENGLSAFYFGNATWNDFNTGNSTAYLVEWSQNQTTGGVPEPTTWAMMVAGFGAVGGALRTRRRRALAVA